MAIILLLAMALGLCACGSSENKYTMYEDINEMLDRGDFDGAIQAIEDLRQQAQGGHENNDGNDDDDSGDTQPSGETQPVGEPTQEERDMLRQYYNILCDLNRYLEGHSISAYDENNTRYEGSRALEYYYNQLSALEAVDKWAGTKYTASEYFSTEINWDRKAVLDSFVIVKDVRLSESKTKTDNMGNVNSSSQMPWTYDENGVLVYLDSEYYVDRILFNTRYHSYYQLEYDDSGRLIQKKYVSGGTVNALETYTYDAAGCLTNIHIKDNSGEYDYACTCDGQGRLTQIAWGKDNFEYTITYTYDTAGHLVKEEKTQYSYYDTAKKYGQYIAYTWTMEYTYDGSKLSSGTYTERSWASESKFDGSKWVVTDNYPTWEQQNRYDYTCDNQGRVISYTVTPGNRVYVHDYGSHKAGDIDNTPSYANVTIETVYGDYYIYSPGN